MQQRVPDLAVVQPGGRGGLETVVHAAVGIDANVGFHSEIPVVSLLRRRQFGIALACLVLGRGRRIDDRRVDQRARAQGDALDGKMRIHIIHIRKDRFGQPMPLQQVAKVQDGGLVRDAVIASSIPAKRRIASLSYSVSSAIGSLSAYQFCRK